MEIYEFCGKGGVGKTNCAVSFALYLSRKGQKTAIIDYDGGHSVKNTLGISGDLLSNRIHEIEQNLSMAVVENTNYVGIVESKAGKRPLREYLEQFPTDQGLIPLADMVNAFFGVPTDIVSLQKFAILVGILRECEKNGFDNVVIDVEPTAGLERLLSNAQSTARSLINLQKQGVVSLIFLGAKWPDIADYLKGDYIRNAHHYSANIEWAVALIRDATYFIVSTPEASPISQTAEVRKIIERFGGQIHGYVVNNIRGEPYEPANIARLECQELPIVKIKRQAGLHIGNDRIPILLKIGESIAARLW